MKRAFFALLILVTSCLSQTPIGIGANGSPLNGISVIATPSTIPVGNTAVMTARYVLADGSSNVFITSLCFWSSSDITKVTVNSAGIATAVASGSATISCTPEGTNSQGLIGSTVVTVGLAPQFTAPSCTTPPCALPPGTNGNAYTFSFAASGGVPPYTFSKTAGSFPTGLSLSSTGCGSNVNCKLSGTLSVNTTTTWTMQVLDAGSNSTTLQVSLTVSATGGPLQQYVNSRTDQCEDGVTPGTFFQCSSAPAAGQGKPLSYLQRLASLGFGLSAPSPYTVTTVDTVPAPGPAGSVTNNCAPGLVTQPTNGQYPCASITATVPYAMPGTAITELDFNSSRWRVTDYSMSNSSAYPCEGAVNGWGLSFNMGSSGAPYRWSSDSTKIMIQNTSSSSGILSWNPATHVATPSGICHLNNGNYSFAAQDAHTLYAMITDKESSVTGTYTTPGFITEPAEVIKQDTTNALATVLAVGTGLMQIGLCPTPPGNCLTPDSTHPWRSNGGGTGVFTPNTVPTPLEPVNFIYIGALCDGVNCGSSTPANYTINWAPLFNFNYVPLLASDTRFPLDGVSCMREGFNSTYTGILVPSSDGTTFAMVLSDNGQSNKTGGTCTSSAGNYPCTGPTNVVTYTTGSGSHGCRIWDLMTDQVRGDFGPVGQMVNGQINQITGTIAGSFGVGDVVKQATTNAAGRVTCTFNVSGVCSLTSITGVALGPITGSPDNSHTWTDQVTTATITTPSLPVHPPFFFPNLAHETHHAYLSSVSQTVLLQPLTNKIQSIKGNTPGPGFTTINYADTQQINTNSYVTFYSLQGADTSYLNCTDLVYTCPQWLVASGTSPQTGTSQNLSPTVGTVVSGNFVSLSNAYDNNLTTAAIGSDNSGTQTPAIARWSGFGPATITVTAATLNVSESTTATSNMPGEFLLEYSLNGGSTWTTYPSAPTQGTTPQTTYTLSLSTTQDMTKVQVRSTAQWTISGLPVTVRDFEVWISITGPTSAGSTLVIADNTGNPNEIYSLPCSKPCPTMAITGSGSSQGTLFPSNPNYWQMSGLVNMPCLDGSCQGHSTDGSINDYRAKVYTAHNQLNPDLPCTVTPTPCPSNTDELSLFPQNIPVDQHGSYLTSYINGDQSPAIIGTAGVAGQAVNPGATPFIPFNAAYWNEIDSGENPIVNTNNAHCLYSDKNGNPTTTSTCPGGLAGIANGCQACMYRHGPSFNTSGSWNFNIQNTIGSESPDGNWFIFPSDHGDTLGCMDGSTKCWSTYVGSGVPKEQIASIVSATVGSPIVQFSLSTGITQGFCTLDTYAGGINGTALQYCGSSVNNAPMQIKMPKFTNTSSTWMNASGSNSTILTLTAVTGTTFTGTLATCPNTVGYNDGHSCTPLNSPNTYANATESSAVFATPLANGIGPSQRADLFIIKLQ